MIWLSVAGAAPLAQLPDAMVDDGIDLHDDAAGDPDIREVPRDVVDGEVVGGRVAMPDEYPDAVGIVFYGAYVGCTGTLVAPNVVITAAHCLDNNSVTHVVVGATDWSADDNEIVPVENAWMHPSYENASNSRDIAVLRLAEDSTYEPRLMAWGCATELLTDGNPATIVGFGNTQTTGQGSTSAKNVGDTLLTDADCSEVQDDNGIITGCVDELRPGGELIAGGRLDVDGDGNQDPAVDACFGDSGGPIYVHGDHGTYVAGVTSRAMMGVSRGFPCRDGGIWVRPDAVMDWLVETTGVQFEEPTCNIKPVVDAPRLTVRAGDREKITLDISDADSDSFELSVLEDSPMGEVKVRRDKVIFKADKDALGPTSVLIQVADNGNDETDASAVTEVRVDILVEEAGCGCQTQSSSAAGLFAFGLVGLLVRRRRA